MNHDAKIARRRWLFLRLGAGVPMVPRLYGVDEQDITEWKRFLKRELAHSRGVQCERTGCKNTSSLHMHEGIVKKNEISMSVPRWREIFSEYNCFLLCEACHLNKGLPRAEFYEMAAGRYGAGAVDEWLESLPFKHVFRPTGEIDWITR